MFELLLSGGKKSDDGGLGPWTVDNNNIGEFLRYSSAYSSNNRAYLLGGEEYVGIVNGYKSNDTVPHIRTAPIDSNGIIGVWTKELNRLRVRVSDSHLVVTGGKVYLLGGINSGNPVNHIQSFPILEDGTLGVSILETNVLPKAIARGQAIITSSRAYIFGNFNTTDIFSAPLLPDGTIGAWVTDSNVLPRQMDGSRVLQTSTRVYLFGGSSNKIHSAPLDPSGTVGNWIEESNVLPSYMNYGNASIIGDRVYLLGGRASPDDVAFSAPILPDDSIGEWRIEDNKFPAILSGAHLIKTHSNVYLIGGNGPTGPTGEVIRAALL